MKNNKLIWLMAALILLMSMAANAAQQIIRYDERGNILSRHQCDDVSIHGSAYQDTFICQKKPREELNVQLRLIESDKQYRECRYQRDCVIIENLDDPDWSPVALYGVPDAEFGKNMTGKSCVRVRETRPKSSSWNRQTLNLCSNDTNIELAYTFALSRSHENIPARFKQSDAKRVCFDQVLANYKYKQFWPDNCIFVRYK